MPLKYGTMFSTVTGAPDVAHVSIAHWSLFPAMFTSLPQQGCADFTLAPRYRCHAPATARTPTTTKTAKIAFLISAQANDEHHRPGANTRPAWKQSVIAGFDACNCWAFHSRISIPVSEDNCHANSSALRLLLLAGKVRTHIRLPDRCCKPTLTERPPVSPASSRRS